jgi:hypothetical protein
VERAAAMVEEVMAEAPVVERAAAETEVGEAVGLGVPEARAVARAEEARVVGQ